MKLEQTETHTSLPVSRRPEANVFYFLIREHAAASSSNMSLNPLTPFMEFLNSGYWTFPDDTADLRALDIKNWHPKYRPVFLGLFPCLGFFSSFFLFLSYIRNPFDSVERCVTAHVRLCTTTTEAWFSLITLPVRLKKGLFAAHYGVSSCCQNSDFANESQTKSDQ